MPTEIERKFLVKSDTWREQVRGESRHLRQGYLALTGRAVVRIRSEGESRAWLGVKEHLIGRAHGEFEYPVPMADAPGLFGLCTGDIIEKTRHHVPVAGHVWEVDEFRGANAGLVLAEIELDAIDESFALPDWAGVEVTEDQRFYNAALSREPWPAFAAEFE